ncbi:hypothetical protein DAY19_11705 [Halobacteriovorax vibrionivorans]|uniref:RHS repeat-associated core domain-containing protein n=2 Tax=Halobacteriovoraceae TaxID=1652132 RepID=A0ABY0IEY6_9BACT|nr:hypothetical protein DAY19_11705 [Halobacteriovorax vibrionivorans]TGD48947.1 hypothetical protein EP118_02025 [Halobacteriovorax sp. Y22]
MSEDPIGFKGKDFNQYRYVNNRTLDFNDPSGNGPVAYGVCLGISFSAAFIAALPDLMHYSDLIEIYNLEIKSKLSLIKDLENESEKPTCSETERLNNDDIISDLEDEIKVLKSKNVILTSKLYGTGTAAAVGVGLLNKACKILLPIPGL